MRGCGGRHSWNWGWIAIAAGVVIILALVLPPAFWWFMKCRPNVAVITNVSPNHLDKHLDYQDYVNAKSAIFTGQTPDDLLVLNRGDKQTGDYALNAPARLSLFSRGMAVRSSSSGTKR